MLLIITQFCFFFFFANAHSFIFCLNTWVQVRVRWDEGKSWVPRSGGAGLLGSNDLQGQCLYPSYIPYWVCWRNLLWACTLLDSPTRPLHLVAVPTASLPFPSLPLPGRALDVHLCLRTGQLPFVPLCYCLFENHSHMSEIFTWHRENYLEPRRSFSL